MARKRDPIAALRRFLYLLGRVLGDARAVAKGKVGRRMGRRAAGKVSGRLMRRIFG